MKRFNYDADSVEEVINYFNNRSYQLISDGFIWSSEVKLLKHNNVVWGVETSFTKNITKPACNVYNNIKEYSSNEE